MTTAAAVLSALFPFFTFYFFFTEQLKMCAMIILFKSGQS